MQVKEFDALLTQTREILARDYSSHPNWPWLQYMADEVVSHRQRLAYTFDLVLQAPGNLLDVGANLVFTSMYAQRREGAITLINYGVAGGRHELRVGTRALPIHLLDIQRDPFPFADGTFDSVLFFEVVEHLSIDPMRTMSEINRVTGRNGKLLLSTPNIVSYRSIAEAIAGRHPHLSSKYLKTDATDRHNREYTPDEMARLVSASGYTIEWSETPSVYSDEEQMASIAAMLGESSRMRSQRGDTIAIRGRKTGPVADRHPAFLYF